MTTGQTNLGGEVSTAHDVPFELIVFPDDVHDSLIHARWIYTFERMEQFLDQHLPLEDDGSVNR